MRRYIITIIAIILVFTSLMSLAYAVNEIIAYTTPKGLTEDQIWADDKRVLVTKTEPVEVEENYNNPYYDDNNWADFTEYEIFYDQLIKRECLKVGVNYHIAVAISRVETGHYSSFYFKEYNNFGGIMDGGYPNIAKYDSIESGVKAFVNLLVWYQNDFGDDIDAWQKRYCPDPTENWAGMVNEVYNWDYVQEL